MTSAAKKAAKKPARAAAKKRDSALAVVARTKRYVKRNPLRIIIGASAIGFALAGLKRLV